VQGSVKTPDVIDKAAFKLLEKIKDKLVSMTSSDFIDLKVRVFDFYFADSYRMASLGNIYFNKITDETYDFVSFKNIKKFMDSIKQEDMIEMFKEKFLSSSNIKLTVYV